ncbi:sigma-70 family RNA polymerase sigma factor [Pseudonocardia alaniniphila]|uniref:Sigma-70 family RNA polymerase sigma factor n=2 Tax=Pseudonocardia alaniniphila TaxID=75291 RepID=A0ABS9TTH4_9PSEU|nr:sigma-70 family RNA polymerase sigma factor [Pseudonocardia alaniniphila]
MAVPLFSFALRFTRDRTLAEDVVQEVLVRAWRRAGHLEPGSDALRGWLFTATRNLLTDMWRAKARRPSIVSSEEVVDLAVAADDVDRVLRRQALDDALYQLTPKHRDVLMQIYYEGRSLAETAHRLGVPLGTVKSRTHHALRELRLLLQEIEVQPG